MNLASARQEKVEERRCRDGATEDPASWTVDKVLSRTSDGVAIIKVLSKSTLFASWSVTTVKPAIENYVHELVIYFINLPLQNINMEYFLYDMAFF